MSFFEELRGKRLAMASVLKDEDNGLRDILEERIYPGRTHFIFELLQNAEDTGATEVAFILEEQCLFFEHNGKSFTKDDVTAITNIGRGTKKDKENKIGKFGVGFKSVFQYTNTPRIFSGEFNFEISDLVLPKEIDSEIKSDGVTVFKLPFDNPEKKAGVAVKEITNGLLELDETSILFLSNIKTINISILDSKTRGVRYIEINDNVVSIIQEEDSAPISRLYYLRYTKPVTKHNDLFVSIAYELKFKKGIDFFDQNKPHREQFEIKAPKLPRVSIFFPAEKEVSGLKFHIHAPFDVEISRASIKDVDENLVLYQELADLCVESLHGIKGLGLLDVRFLNVLPNSGDELGEKYEPIREQIFEALNNNSLVPTKSGSHAPANRVLRSSKSMQEFFGKEDLEMLSPLIRDQNEDEDESAFEWGMNAATKSRGYKLLNDLEIYEWEFKDLDELLYHEFNGDIYLDDCGNAFAYDTYYNEASILDREDAYFDYWLASKSPEWHLKFYSFLYKNYRDHKEGFTYFAKGSYSTFNGVLLKNPKSHEAENGERVHEPYGWANKCFFVPESLPDGLSLEDSQLDFVDPKTYNSVEGESTDEQAKEALEFLKMHGTERVGEKQEIEIILRLRYSGREDWEGPPNDIYLNDVAKFINYSKEESPEFSIFEDYYIFQVDDGDWCKASQVYIDSPHKETGLCHYFEELQKLEESFDLKRYPLNVNYQKLSIDIEEFIKFSAKVGVLLELEPEETSIYNNPESDELLYVRGRETHNKVRRDYQIPGLPQVLGSQNVNLSLMLVQRLEKMERYEYYDYCIAYSQNNSTSGGVRKDSQMVCTLKTVEWIPQLETDGNLMFVRPDKANVKKLPKELKAIIEKHLSEKRHWERDGWLVNIDFGSKCDESEDDGLEDSDEVDMSFEERVNHYLRQEYTDENGVMICQICEEELPFKKLDGHYHFESVPILSEDELFGEKSIYNYLALCPNHAAMFNLSNPNKDNLKNLFIGGFPDGINIELDGVDYHVFFSDDHAEKLNKFISSL